MNDISKKIKLALNQVFPRARLFLAYRQKAKTLKHFLIKVLGIQILYLKDFS